MANVTQELVKSIFDYNKDTGEFIYRKKTSNRTNPGDDAGWIGSHGYKAVSIRYKKYLVHRLIFLYMTGSMPSKFVDHINHDRLDNRWCNLREASRHDNQANMSLPKDNTSGHIGIYQIKESGKFRVRICGQHIGCFDSIEDAVKARKEAALALGYHANHGDRNPKAT